MAATAASRGGSGASCVWKPIVSPPVARGEVVSRGGAGRDGAGAAESPVADPGARETRREVDLSRENRRRKTCVGGDCTLDTNEKLLSFVGMTSAKKR